MKNAYQDGNLSIPCKEVYGNNRENDIKEYRYVNEEYKEHEG